MMKSNHYVGTFMAIGLFDAGYVIANPKRLRFTLMVFNRSKIVLFSHGLLSNAVVLRFNKCPHSSCLGQ